MYLTKQKLPANNEITTQPAATPKKRGRKPKIKVENTTNQTDLPSAQTEEKPKKRGRKPKNKTE